MKSKYLTRCNLDTVYLRWYLEKILLEKNSSQREVTVNDSCIRAVHRNFFSRRKRHFTFILIQVGYITKKTATYTLTPQRQRRIICDVCRLATATRRRVFRCT